MTTTFIVAVIFISYTVCGYWFVHCLYERFHERVLVQQNYRGQSIVQSFGIAIPLLYGIFILLLRVVSLFWTISVPWLTVLFFLFVIGSLGIMGWIDDWYETHVAKGIRGHVRMLLKERQWTTGCTKIVIGTLTSLATAIYVGTTWLDCLLVFFVMLFSIHVFNLFDVRPLRCLKWFWASILAISFMLHVELVTFLVAPILIATVLLFLYERRLLVMLGDSGANILGGIFGYVVALQGNAFIKIVVICTFIVLTALAERVSFHAVIQANPVLRKWDNWLVVQKNDR